MHNTNAEYNTIMKTLNHIEDQWTGKPCRHMALNDIRRMKRRLELEYEQGKVDGIKRTTTIMRHTPWHIRHKHKLITASALLIIAVHLMVWYG